MSSDADRVGHATRNQPEDITHEVHGVSSRPFAYGGFADIYSGLWTHDGNEVKVAIKVLRVRSLDPANAKLFSHVRREASVWKRLSHPNIQELYGLYEGLGPGPAMVSQFHGNGDINAYVARNAAHPELDNLKLNLFFDVTSGLRFLHDNFIIHGDIKGCNVLISDDGVARLIDFAFSRLLWGSSQSAMHTGVQGTSRWMAPELILNEEVPSYASDVWGVGCLLIEVWCGVPPYHTKGNDLHVMLALSHREPPVRPVGIPDFPWSLVEACCNFEPAHRPAPVQLMAGLAIQLTMPVITRMVTRGRPLDSFSSNLLRAIEISINTADSHLTAQLRSTSHRDLALEVIRMLSLWSLGTPPESRLYTNALYRWCLNAVVDRPQPISSNGRMANGSHGEEDMDGQYDGEDEEGRIDPSKLLPFATLLAIVETGYYVAVMSHFAREFQSPARSFAHFPDDDHINGTVDFQSRSSAAPPHLLHGHIDPVTQVATAGELTVTLWNVERQRSRRPGYTYQKLPNVSPLPLEVRPDIASQSDIGEIVAGLKYLDVTQSIHTIASRPIAWGGSADIYEAMRVDRKVALKIVRKCTSDQEVTTQTVQRWRQEILTWANLPHPNIIPLIGLCWISWSQPLPAIVSTWCSFGNMREYLKLYPATAGRKVKILDDILTGLDYLHFKSIVHADMKGANVLINDDEVACISDFGLSALFAQHLAATRSAVGTFRWMAPELFDKHPRATAASDVWAIGGVIYEIITGKHPYHTLYEAQAIMAISKRELPLRPDNFPNKFWALAMQCWNVESGDRPSTTVLLEWMQTLALYSESELQEETKESYDFIGPHRRRKLDEGTALDAHVKRARGDDGKSIARPRIHRPAPPHWETCHPQPNIDPDQDVVMSDEPVREVLAWDLAAVQEAFPSHVRITPTEFALPVSAAG